jgi:CheY-like chemotaxis protein
VNEPLIVTSFETLRVLVIGDDRAILELVEAVLKSAGIGGVVKAVSALGALNILADKHKRFSCIICDYGMEVKDGLTLLKEIRSGKHPYIQRDQCFIMLTAHGQEAVVRAALELDVNGYVRKPVTKDSLSKAIHRAFNRTPVLKGPEVYAAVAVPPPA